jgi:hypothetical protein
MIEEFSTSLVNDHHSSKDSQTTHYTIIVHHIAAKTISYNSDFMQRILPPVQNVTLS